MITRRVKGTSGPVESVRPSFTFFGEGESGGFSHESILGQLTEDIRNVLEQIRDKQMLQCEARDDLRRLLAEARKTNRLLVEFTAARFPAPSRVAKLRRKK
jgi:hypothetical protein